jgi:hypothetical protein
MGFGHTNEHKVISFVMLETTDAVTLGFSAYHHADDHFRMLASPATGAPAEAVDEIRRRIDV